jgi:hypothetical protein
MGRYAIALFLLLLLGGAVDELVDRSVKEPDGNAGAAMEVDR